MSKWISEDLFNKFVEDKINEGERGIGDNRFPKWKTPEPGGIEKAKTYTGRFLPDMNGNFYKKMLYHMIQVGDKWRFILCPKTHSFDNYCPICAVVAQLYKGSESDKRLAGNFKRKEKFVANWYVVDDPRDNEIQEDDKKSSGKVFIYEFPSKIEKKIKSQLIDKKEGIGQSIFDPGKDGYNFLVKVALTKPGPDGKSWVNYDESEFTRKNSAILSSDNEIEEVMNSRFNLTEYLDSLIKDNEELVDILKTENVFDFIEDEYNRRFSIKSNKSETQSPSKNEDVEDNVSDDQEEDDESFLDKLNKL